MFDTKPIIYLAAPYREQETMRKHRSTLLQLGYRVESRWIDEPAISDDLAPSDYYRATCAAGDMEDVQRADVLVCFPGVGAGHHTELGMALEAGKLCIIVGKRNNIFHYLPQVMHLGTMDDLLAWLEWKYGP